MLSRFSRVFNDSSRNVKRKVINIYAFLISVNILIWVVALIAFHRYPLLLGTAVLAYSFGLRHAVDADHIAAIDNVTRKLMQENKRPVAVGFFFSLGHSTVVIFASVAIALTTTTIHNNFPSFEKVGGLISSIVSALFLLVIAAINMVVLWDVYKTFQTVKRGGIYDEQSLDEFLNQRGLLGRIFRPLFRLIDSSWQMFPLGFLFGLGFDTATEVALLGISANQAAKGLPIWSILLFPALFTAGMSLIDTTDGILMLGAYGWAYVKPIRKLYYNMTITLVSVLVAVVIGGIEALNIIGDQLQLKSPFWDFISKLGDNFGTIGYLIIGIFIFSWLLSTIIYKVNKYDDLEVTSATTAKHGRNKH
ncbi:MULTISPECIES: HoxN/HupN/NixA family nickel/cobalt transporter [unclassified Nostoc]|uniref:HoxN/HupN/NixA family nickel/cobalt transporter n=1 Tax=unclassified Nostoc TaxID=2593658 RepID=UPI002630A2B0|nr:HoxN/HupN/NixA family nickel/cobalt transporter [Nostoc sp. S13]MDF5737661.1 HoxN/HupN/NixA family nickel/cobalt transporter [Nostoc sp. S13]